MKPAPNPAAIRSGESQRAKENSLPLEFNGEEFDASRTTTVEIKDVGTTKVSVPDAAKKLVGP